MNNKIYFDIITDDIFNVYSKIKLFLLKTDNFTILNINSNITEDIYKLLNILYNNIIKIKNNEILLQGIRDKHYDVLKYIKYFLIKLSTKNSRSYHDKIFINILKTDKHMPLGITIVFEDFIKGITYFEDEMENKKKYQYIIEWQVVVIHQMILKKNIYNVIMIMHLKIYK